MKKYFLLAAMAAFALVACKPANTDDPDDNPDDKEYVQPIDIDGDFADWAKLDASKVATAKCPSDANKTALKLVKVYADEFFIFVYFEWDKEQITHVPDKEHVPFHIYLNGDGNATTGGYADQFTDACSDVLFEGFVYPDGAAVGNYEPAVCKWTGETNGTGWSWDDLGEIAGITKGAGVEGKYELQIVRELYPLGKIADKFSVGFDIQQNWDSVGVLPIASPTDANPSGYIESLQVTTVK